MTKTLSFELSTAAYAKAISGIIILLLIANCGSLFMQHVLDHPEIWGLVPLFHFDREQNLPTFFSSLLLLLSAALLFAAAQKARSTGTSSRPWALLALVFAFLSIDEITSVHEKVDALIKFYTPTSGILHHAWVAPYGLAVLILAIVLCPWFLALNRWLQVMFFTSGAVFVGGALGVEIINGLYYSGLTETAAETTTLIGDSLATIEELAEMTGVSVFIYALLTHLSGDHGKMRLEFA